MRLFLRVDLLQGGELALGEDQPILGHSRFRRFSRFIVSRSCYTSRTPEGETEWPSFLASLARRIWPKAGCFKMIALTSGDAMEQ
ncbi:hypothetical protein X733_33410 [Mesorhizobium sp. L2C067A000]|nr:hypothetical protein X733_33410 [Mesorhizobium sp. L2C067A000]